MGIFNKKPKFKSSIPEKFQNLSLDSMSDDTMEEILIKFPEIKTPEFIDTEYRKGNLTDQKTKELKKKALIHGIEEFIKKEKEDFEKDQSIFNKSKQDKVKKTLISVYENEYTGIISRDESNFLIDALK